MHEIISGDRLKLHVYIEKMARGSVALDVGLGSKKAPALPSVEDFFGASPSGGASPSAGETRKGGKAGQALQRQGGQHAKAEGASMGTKASGGAVGKATAAAAAAQAAAANAAATKAEGKVGGKRKGGEGQGEAGTGGAEGGGGGGKKAKGDTWAQRGGKGGGKGTGGPDVGKGAGGPDVGKKGKEPEVQTTKGDAAEKKGKGGKQVVVKKERGKGEGSGEGEVAEKAAKKKDEGKEANEEGVESDDEDHGQDDADKDGRTVFVGSIPHKMTKKQVKALFKDCGEISSVRMRSIPIEGPALDKKASIVMGKIHPQRETCNAYVVFEDVEGALKAIKLNGTQVLPSSHSTSFGLGPLLMGIAPGKPPSVCGGRTGRGRLVYYPYWTRSLSILFVPDEAA